MSETHTYSSNVAFTPAVKAIQTRKGSREGYAQVERNGGWRTEIDERLASFLADTNSFFLATATADGQPYIQHRGGPKGFVKVLDKHTIAFADYAGNRQFLTQGNLSEKSKAHIFIMDYAHRRRVKIWGEAHVVDDDPALLESLMPKGYRRAARAGDPVQDRGMGHQLPATHSAEVRCRRCRAGDERSVCEDRGARGRGGEVEGGVGGASIGLFASREMPAPPSPRSYGERVGVRGISRYGPNRLPTI